MRGLNVRVQYANAKIAEIVDPNTDAVCLAWHDAQAEGYRDYQEQLDSVPVMFADVPELVSAWYSGYEMAAEDEEVSHCLDCNNGSGNPCPIHG